MNKHKIFRIVLIVLILLTVLMIWGNSMVGRSTSIEQSNTVSGFLQSIIDFLHLPFSVSVVVVRKAAHFLSFFLLGTEITLYRMSGRKLNRKDLLKIFTCVFLVAFLDETIQIFSQRGPLISDVWLDLSGGVTAMLTVFALHYLFAACKRKRRGN